MFKKLILWRLETYVKQYMKKHQPKLVVVTGSVGKTSTKMAIATVVGEQHRVRVEETNHNTHFSVPTSLLGVSYPSNIRSVREWREVFKAMKYRIEQPNEVDVIVQELGTDQPGDIARFMSYLKPDIAVVTAVSDEHMEFFKTMDAVAKEELSVAKYSGLTIINRDDIDESYARYADTKSIDTYGLGEKAEYRLVLEPSDPLQGRIGHIVTPDMGNIPINTQLIGAHSTKAALAGALVGLRLGMTTQSIAVGMSRITSVSGRMQLLRGMNESLIIDDTYNSSPLAAIAALQTLMESTGTQKIAILGSMNELGTLSPGLHEKVGKACDSSRIDYVVTIGELANKYLAPAAQANGCQVRTFNSPYAAGGFVHSVLKPGTIVLAKGSQNGVFAEEAIKVILHSVEDEQKLVRQSEDWRAKKAEQFSR